MAKTQQIVYVGFWRRFGAFWLDQFLLFAITAPVVYLFYGYGYTALELLISDIIPIVFYVIFWVKLGATPGKILVSCRIVDERSGNKPTLVQAWLRVLGYFVSFITLGLGFLWILWDPRKQGLHDKIAKTLVIAEADIAEVDPWPPALEHYQ